MSQTPQSNQRPPTVVTVAQLPFSCPPPTTALWDMHPRVYLPFASSGESCCPYCGARYRLDNRGHPAGS
ncbi:Zinc-finger domain protein [Gammaproteobacteria bacterium]